MLSNKSSDQLGDYTRIPAISPEDVRSDHQHPKKLDATVLFSTFSPVDETENKNIPPDSESRIPTSSSSEVKMKTKNITRIWNRNRTTYEVEQKNRKKEPGKLWTILKSLRYANKMDTFILILSIVSAVLSGFITPYNVYLLLTPVLGAFIEAEKQESQANMTSEIQLFADFKEFGYGFLIIGVITLVFAIFQIMGSEIAARNILTKIKTSYLSKMLSIDISWYDQSQEQFVNTVSHDLQSMVVLFDSRMTNAAEILSFFFFGSMYAFLASWEIALLSLALMLFTMICIYFILQASKRKGKSRQRYIRKCTKITSEVLMNARTVAAYGGEYKEIKRYKTALEKANKYKLKHTTVLATGIAFNYFQLCICYMVAYYFSVRKYLVGNFDPSYLAVILGGQINAIYNCSFMLNTISDLNMATDSAYRVMTFIDSETNSCKFIKQGINPDTFKADVSFKNVQFSYPTNLQTKVLHDLTLDIEPGKVTAVVGTSGAGKSTIVSLISRLYDVTSGQIIIGGVDIKKLDVDWLRNQISVVRQEPTLFDTSIEENIRYGKTTATLEEITEAAKTSYAHGFIDKLPSGYSSIVGERGIKLSGGQKQRIAIARAIVRKPKLLLLDEATSALDFHSEGIVQEALDNAMRDRTTLIIAHRMSTVRKADVIYAIKDGYVVEKGSHSELMELKGYYHSLAKTQELEEKDKVVTLNPGSDKEELIEEAISVNEDNLEIPQNKKIQWRSKKNVKTLVVWLLAILFTLITSTFLTTFYYIFSLFCQSFTYTNDELNFIALNEMVYLFVLGVIIFFAVILMGVMSTIGSQLWLGKLQKNAFRKIVSMDISWFDKSRNSPSECLEILTNSPPLIESVTGDRAAQVAVFMLSLLFAVGFSIIVSPSISLITLPIVFVFIIINCVRMKSRDADARSASLTTQSTKVATEYVQNMKTIQVLNCQKYVINQYQDMLVRSKKEAIVSIIWFAAVCSLSKTLIRWLLGAILILCDDVFASGNAKGTLIIGVISALCLTSTLAVPALILTSQYPAARQATKQLNRIADSRTSLNILTDHGIKPEISGNIVFENIKFSYPTRDKVQVLRNLNINIEAGTTVALVGDSGCGKSTIISLLERFYLPNEGKIMIDGYNINDINVRYLRSQMGFVSQEPVLFDMTIKENIIYGLEEEVTMDSVIEAAKIANIHNFIMKLPQAYDTSVGERGSKLSGGQKQRIAITRAVLRNPKILLLDEATSALDTENEKVVQEALENALAGRTNIVIAHRLSTIRKADKIVVIKNGQVIEEGNHEQLMEKKGHYFNLLNR